MVLDLVLIGLAVTLFPFPLMAFVLVLSTRGGVWKGLAFIVAWLACLVAVVAAVLLLTGGEPPEPKSSPSTAALAGKLAVGVGLVGYAEHRRRRAARPHRPSRMTNRLERVSAWSSAGLAVLLQPWGLVAAGAATVVEADLSHLESYLALLAYCLIASSSLLAMEVYALFAPRSARVRLLALRTWLDGHQDQAIIGLCLVIGLVLVSKSLYQLTA
ncbi:GAP family protein [Actinacidiphila glaucinigra]|uniref:Sap, sulfolipid-1-addressing protein n=1 Tax=Actinacidiphila glaucinigra TaxID=235986 RepID=A0A239JV28_9ACTN|nr:GAP family protein [Actinacidiphila glaucinigra]SNT09645.1 Sap, sulfolipid-1-addressing protein [Actinacidiphila glaucinigra]